MTSDKPARALPPIIQGGMGVGVSGWQLARAVASHGQLGVVSGTALDVVHARRLADGDLAGDLRRAYEAFPIAGVADRVLDRYFIDGGRDPSMPYRNVPMFRPSPLRPVDELTVLANFAEVWLAKQDHEGCVGINYLQKIQIPTPHAIYGALLAGVDVVLMGAGIPSAIPHLLDSLAAGAPATYRVDVDSDPTGVDISIDPNEWIESPPVLARPAFLAIVASHTLATYLAKDPATRPDGFVVEGPTAGGHNAPPRGRMVLDDAGQPVYGSRDEVDLDKLNEIGLPYWLAGGYGHPSGLGKATALGANGIQVGTAFALCDESGMMPSLKAQVITEAREGKLTVITDPVASPSGYPFKLAQIDGTMSDRDIYEARERVCDLGYLRVGYRRDDGSVGLRCPGEPVDTYLRKGGDRADTDGRKCLCNGLMSTVGLAQVRDGEPEAALVTVGDDADAAVAALAPSEGSWSAADVIDYLLSG